MEDIINRKFGKYTVISDLGSRDLSRAFDKRTQKYFTVKMRYFLCECECGTRKEVTYSNLITGRAKGCFKCREYKKRGRDLSKKSYHPLFKVYSGMLNRCYNPKNKFYYRYGGRGIKVDERWLGDNGFYTFISDMPVRPGGHSLDRIDNDKGYSKDNCRWATAKEQSNNTTKINFSHSKDYDIVSYLRWLGFKPVIQRDGKENFIDNDYLRLNRVFVELHDDGVLFLWLDGEEDCVIYSTNVNEVLYSKIVSDIDYIITNKIL